MSLSIAELATLLGALAALVEALYTLIDKLVSGVRATHEL